MAVPLPAHRTPASAGPRLRSASSPRAALVARLTRPGLDPAKSRIRHRLLRLSDEQLQSGLGWSRADVAALRSAGRADDDPAALPPLPMAA